MISAFFSGFFTGLSLIIAIGAQNSFVLRQGIIGKHVFHVALFCALSDALLITFGVAGISFLLNNFVTQTLDWLFGFAAIWLFGYGIIRLKAFFTKDLSMEIEKSLSKNLLSTLSVAFVLTFANPHVYLDTMILIGTISQQFSNENKFFYTLGASMASFVFFFSLAYGAKLLAPLMKKPASWRILDGLIAIIMFSIAINLAKAGNWL